jgi:hypothetical protein
MKKSATRLPTCRLDVYRVSGLGNAPGLYDDDTRSTSFGVISATTLDPPVSHAVGNRYSKQLHLGGDG